MQSERMYQAVSGQGGVTKLVILPHESHGYREPTSDLPICHDEKTKSLLSSLAS